MPQKKILIIDDDNDLQSLLRKRLESQGFDCASAMSVEEGLQDLKSVRPDLVILDLGFQGANGTVFLKHAKSWLPPGSKIPPIIVLSCYSDKEIVDYTLDLGAVRFLSKPYDPSTLVSMIHQYVS